MRLRTLIPVAAALCSVAAAAPAQAGTVTYEGDTLVYRAGPGEDNLVTLYGSSQPGRINIGDTSANSNSVPFDRCDDRTADGFGIDCDMPARIRLELGDGVDGISFGSDWPKSINAEARLGDGADRIEHLDRAPSSVTIDGEAGNDTITGGSGNDVIRGGPGNDSLTGGPGDDRLEGGDGDDNLKPDYYADPFGNDVVDGGAGKDTVEDWDTPGSDHSHPPVSISLDGQANDGRPGEQDNVVNVEHFESYISGHFVLSDGPDEVNAWSSTDEGNSTIEGRGGADRLTGGNYVENIDGGAGDDRLEGGYNNDTITGGPGRDQIYGDSTASQCGYLQSCTVPFGNDTIYARDGEADQIDCGVGEDTVIADPADTIAPNCEKVDIGSGPANDDQDNQNGSTLTGTIARIKLKKALASGLPVKVTAPGAGKVTVSVKKGRTVVAQGSKSATAAGNVSVTAKFTKAARKSLKRSRKVKLSVVVTFAPAGGGAKQSASAALTLK
jgi:Ca2+-binding RTX toxin-like protein